MKELTIEEKAKAYDKALEIAKAWYKLDNNDLSNDDLETLFPELKERDERIRKEIIEYIKTGTYHKSWIAWLEKQGEIDKSSYEIAEKEKREFVGDGFIKCYADFQDFKEGNTYWLEYIGNDKYNVRSDNLLGKTYHITPCQLYTVFKKQTWLEKQGEQKVNYTTLVETGNGGINARVTRELPIEMKSAEESLGIDSETHNEIVNDCIFGENKPKFKVGDWIIFNGLILYIKEVVKGFYRTISIGGIPNSYDWNIDNVARLWTIQDAKDGDVLACENGWTCIFNCLNDNLFASHCFMDSEGWFCEDGGQAHTLDERICGEIHPATKEQRDTLIKTMTDAGYTFDFDKKELNKSNSYCKEHCKGFQETGKCFADYDCRDKREAERKSTWSKEDDYRLNMCITAIEAYYKWDNMINWLKSIKKRIGG